MLFSLCHHAAPQLYNQVQADLTQQPLPKALPAVGLRAVLCSLVSVCRCLPHDAVPPLQQLLGVALVAVQGGLGEASALGLCSLHPSQLSLTAWSSGTGFAGEAAAGMGREGPALIGGVPVPLSH